MELTTVNAQFHQCSIKSFNLNAIRQLLAQPDGVLYRCLQLHIYQLALAVLCARCTKVMVMALCLRSTRSILHITDDSFR